MTSTSGDRPVVVVTGGGGGIGAAIAEELGRTGAHVVTLDPLVTLDGAEQLAEVEETTADRIVAAGGSAEASPASVTDGDAVRALLERLRRDHGRLDAVVNVAGITRPTAFATGTDEDWRAVLSVHLDGYLNVLAAALPIMEAQGHGQVVGVTSGSGWRPADTGAYGCAKRAVASLTWQLGSQTPPGVTVNAISPIAVTRMVTAALGRQASRPGAGASASTGGLSLGALPAPEEIGPLGAHLAGGGRPWLRGQILFAGGPEVALLERPRLLEVVQAEGVASLAPVVEALSAGALAPAGRDQVAGGGSNPRFRAAYAGEAAEVPPSTASCLVVTDRPDDVARLVAAVTARGARCSVLDVSRTAPGFDAAAAALAGAEAADAVILHRAGPTTADREPGWRSVLAEHEGIVDAVHADAAWVRAVAHRSAEASRPTRAVTIVDATTAGGRSRAQAATQLARASGRATDDRVAASSVGVEAVGAAAGAATAELVAHLACSPAGADLAGADLVVGAGWLGGRSHPRPATSITTGTAAVPPWFDAVLREAVAAQHPTEAP